MATGGNFFGDFNAPAGTAAPQQHQQPLQQNGQHPGGAPMQQFPPQQQQQQPALGGAPMQQPQSADPFLAQHQPLGYQPAPTGGFPGFGADGLLAQSGQQPAVGSTASAFSLQPHQQQLPLNTQQPPGGAGGGATNYTGIIISDQDDLQRLKKQDSGAFLGGADGAEESKNMGQAADNLGVYVQGLLWNIQNKKK